MGLIEIYDNREEGFQQVVIKDSWRAGTLSYCPEYDIEQFKLLVKTQHSDRAFSLLTGSAVLIIQDQAMNKIQTITMERGSAYNVSHDVWHAILMGKGSQIFIVEGPDAHLDEMAIRLTNEQASSISKKLSQKFNPSE